MAAPTSTIPTPGFTFRPKAPKYIPGNLSIYFRQLKDYFEVSNITDEDTKMAIFRMGLPAPEYKCFVVGCDLPKTFNAAKNLLLDIYEPDPSPQNLADSFLSAKQSAGESVMLFYLRLAKSAKRAYPSLDNDALEALVRTQLLRGLRDSRLRDVARLSEATNLEDLVREICRHEAVFGEPEVVNQISRNDDDHSMKKTLDTLLERLDALSKEVSDLKAAKVDEPRRVTCWNCGRRNHYARECRQAPASCERCEGRHLTRFCRSGQVSYRHCLSIGEGNEKSPNFTSVFVRINDLHRTALIDTGSNHSLMAAGFWSLIGEPSLEPSSMNLISAGGAPLNVRGAVDLEVAFGSRVVPCNFVVVDHLNVDVLIGSRFMEVNKCAIDFENKTFAIGSHAEHLLTQPSDTVALVAASESYTIKAGSESLIFAKTQGVLRKSKNLLVSGDSCPRTRIKARTLVASCVVSSEVDEYPVRIINFSDGDVRISKGEIIAKVETVQTKHPSQNVYSVSNQLDSIDWTQYFDLKHLNPSEKEQVIGVLTDNRSAFAFSKDEIGFSTAVQHGIDTKDHPPIKTAVRRLPYCHQNTVDDEIEWLLEKGIIEPSTSPWSAPIVMVRKKDGTHRMCIDYRNLNSVTRKDNFPIPRIDDILDSLSGNEFFSTLDLYSGFWQMPVSPTDAEKTAFVTHKGLFQFTRLPMGLCNAPASFQRLMSIVLGKMLGEYCLCYLDDIIVLGTSFHEHLENLERVLKRLKEYGLTLKPKKCELFTRQVNFLGHVVSREGVSVDDQKIEAIKNWPVPSCKIELRAFMGLAGYYRRFIKDFAGIAVPLFRLSGEVPFSWDQECQGAFDTLKRLLCTTPVLSYPQFGKDSGRFILDTDASNFALGGVLSQEIEGEERVIAYGSKTMNKAERNYCATRKELLAVVYFCTMFRPYLLGRQFVVRTDHASLTWLKNLKDPEGQLARWILKLQDYDFEIVHRAGHLHRNADALSRNPRHQGNNTCPACTVNAVTVDPSDARRTSSWSLQHDQELDHDVQVLRVSLEAGRSPSHDERNALSSWGHKLAKKLDDLSVRGSCMGFNRRDKWLPVVPPCTVSRILKSLHEDLGGGHLGTSKLTSKVEERFWWPDYRNDILSFVAGCRVCSISKNPPKKAEAELHPIKTSRPFQIVAADIVGPLPMTPGGHSYILVLIDLFTKWVELAPLKDQTTASTTSAILNLWISRYGVPERVHTDQGSNFVSSSFESFCRNLGMQHTCSSPLHPQGNGQVERFNRTLKSLLKTHVIQEFTWDEVLPECLMAYRSSKQESTKFSPFQLMFGDSMSLPIDNEERRHDDPLRPGALFLQLKEKLYNLHREASQNATQAKARQKESHDQHINRRQYEEGDAVWLYSPVANLSRKFVRPWRGPYQILEVLPPVNYRIRFWGRREGNTMVVHHNRLKPCSDVARALELPVVSDPVGPRSLSPASSSDSDGDFEIPFVPVGADDDDSTDPMIDTDDASFSSSPRSDRRPRRRSKDSLIPICTRRYPLRSRVPRVRVLDDAVR